MWSGPPETERYCPYAVRNEGGRVATADKRSEPAPAPTPRWPREQYQQEGDEDVLAWHLRHIDQDDRRDGAAPWDSAI